MQVVGAAHTRKLFEKRLTHNLQNKVVAPRGYNFYLAETLCALAGSR
jgi:hypothetical protein